MQRNQSTHLLLGRSETNKHNCKLHGNCTIRGVRMVVLHLRLQCKWRGMTDVTGQDCTVAASEACSSQHAIYSAPAVNLRLSSAGWVLHRRTALRVKILQVQVVLAHLGLDWLQNRQCHRSEPAFHCRLSQRSDDLCMMTTMVPHLMPPARSVRSTVQYIGWKV